MKLKVVLFIGIFALILGCFGIYCFYSYQNNENEFKDIFQKIDKAIATDPQNKQKLLLIIDKLYYKYKDDSSKYVVLDKVKSYLLKKEQTEDEKFDLQYLSTITISKGARPEIIATGNKIYAIYLNITDLKKRTFNLKIYNATTFKEISTKVLVNLSSIYGLPTDIRVVSDGNYAYAFYQTENESTKKSYLWGAKYDLNNNFKLIKKTEDPLIEGVSYSTADSGDELLDDPAPLIGPNGPIVITRIKDTYDKSGKSGVIVRELTTDLEQIDMINLDLSSEIHGGPRQLSCIYKNGFYYLFIPTTVGYSKIDSDLLMPSDIQMLRFDQNWNLLTSKTVSQQYNDTETQVTGLKSDFKYFYIVYRDIVNSPQMFDQMYVPLKVYDSKFNIIYSKILYTLDKSKANIDWKPSIEVTEKYLYFGIGNGDNAEIMIYKKI